MPNKNKPILRVAVAIALASAVAGAQARPQFQRPTFHIHEERQNVSFAFTGGAVGVNDKEGALDGMLGNTRDVKGQDTIFRVTFSDALSDARAFALPQHQGRLNGTITCKAIYIGTGPMVPKMYKYGFWGEQCTLTTVSF